MLLIFSITFLVYLTLANANILLSEGIYTLYPYFQELFFGPWVYMLIPILIGEIVLLGIVMYLAWEKITVPPSPELEELEKITKEEGTKKNQA